MLKGNLSTRPFYNDRLASLLIGGLAVVVVALTAYNAWTLVTLSTERRDFKVRIDRDAREAARLRSAAQVTEQRINPKALATLAGSAREANDLIDQRTFSWTAFFGVIEHTLPIDARLTMVMPRVERGALKVAITVIARDLSDVDVFCSALQDTGQFYDVAPTDQHVLDDASVSATIDASYLSPNAPPAGPPKTTPAAAPRPPRS